MPFTPSHAVVALPFVRGPLIPGAIAVGAMTPDLPMFLRALPLSYALTHAWRWLPATVVLAWVLYAIWRAILFPALVEAVPARFAQRLPAAATSTLADRMRAALPRTPRGIALLGVSLVIGVASHIAWDLLTHEGRWGEQIMPLLGEHWGPLPGHSWLQYGSSLFGAAVVTAWALGRIRRTPPRSVRRIVPRAARLAWGLSLPVLLVVVTTIALVGAGGFTREFTRTSLAYGVLVPTAATWGAATVLLCAVVTVARSRSSYVHDGSSAPKGRGRA